MKQKKQKSLIVLHSSKMNDSTKDALTRLRNILTNNDDERRMLEMYGNLPDHLEDAYQDMLRKSITLVDESEFCSYCWASIEDKKTYGRRPCGHLFCVPCLKESVNVQEARAPHFRCCGTGCNLEFNKEPGEKVFVRVAVKID